MTKESGSKKSSLLRPWAIATSLLLGSVFIFSCAEEGQIKDRSQSEIGAAESESIIGGELVRRSDSIKAHTVGLYDVARQGICTGTLIAQDLVLTAAHCINTRISKMRVVFGTSFSRPEHVRRATDYAISPLWARRQNEAEDTGDIALIKFAGGVPKGYRPSEFLVSFRDIVAGMKVTLSGFGMSDGRRKTGSGFLRKVQATVGDPNATRTEIMMDQRNRKGACMGDSGGPAYIVKNGRYQVFGVTSRGLDPRGDCSFVSLYTSVHAHWDWIVKEARKLSRGNRIGQFALN